MIATRAIVSPVPIPEVPPEPPNWLPGQLGSVDGSHGFPDGSVPVQVGSDDGSQGIVTVVVAGAAVDARVEGSIWLSGILGSIPTCWATKLA